MDGQPVQIHSPEDALACGIGLVPEDRKLQGLILGMSVEQNMTLSSLKELEFMGVLSARREHEMARDFVSRLAVRTPTTSQRVRNLSGGNQQKVVLAKVLARRPKVLMLDEPTRGIDVGGKREIYRLIDELKRDGIAIIVVSSELPELIGIADRILVMSEGHITGEFDRAHATEELLMHAAVPSSERTHAMP